MRNLGYYVAKNLVIYTCHLVLKGHWNVGDYSDVDMLFGWVKRGMHTEF